MDEHSVKSIGLTIDKLKQLSPEAVAQLLEENATMRPVRAVRAMRSATSWARSSLTQTQISTLGRNAMLYSLPA